LSTIFSMNSNLDCSRSSFPETTCGHYCVSRVFSHFLICQMPTELSKLNLIHMPLREREREREREPQIKRHKSFAFLLSSLINKGPQSCSRGPIISLILLLHPS